MGPQTKDRVIYSEETMAMRSPSEERAEADIASLEAQLKELMAANKFGECAALKERIDQKRNAQSKLSELKAQLEKARALTDFMQCAEIQKKIDELKVYSTVINPRSHASLLRTFFSSYHPVSPPDS